MSEVTNLEHFKKNIKVCIGVFVVLLVLTVITVGASYIHFGAPNSHVGNVTVALIVAVMKATLVAAYFMHLNSEKRTIYRVLVFTGIFFGGLMFLTLLSFHDAVRFP